MRIALILIGAAVLAYLIAMGIRAHLDQRNDPSRRKLK